MGSECRVRARFIKTGLIYRALLRWLAEGVYASTRHKQLSGGDFKVRYFLGLQSILQGSCPNRRRRHRESHAHAPGAAARAAQAAFQEPERKVPPARPDQRGHVQLASVDAFPAALHAVTRPPGAQDGDAPAQVGSLTNRLDTR